MEQAGSNQGRYWWPVFLRGWWLDRIRNSLGLVVDWLSRGKNRDDDSKLPGLGSSSLGVHTIETGGKEDGFIHLGPFKCDSP